MKFKSNWKPNLFIPAFFKCGTTALCDYLAQHPDIYVIDCKEPRTLTSAYEDLGCTNIEKSFRYYNKLYTILKRNTYNYEIYKSKFEYNNKKYRVDASQSYSSRDECILEIKNFNPTAKILLVIREPIVRLFSVYFFFYPYHRVKFDKFLNNHVIPYVEDLLFYNRIVRFVELFGTSNVRVIDNKLLYDNPQFVMNKIFEFLNLPSINIKPTKSNITTKSSLYYTVLIENAIKIGNILEKSNLTNNKIRYILRNIYIKLYNFGVQLDKIKQDKKIVLSKQLPVNLSNILISDYTRTVQWCKVNDILIDDSG